MFFSFLVFITTKSNILSFTVFFSSFVEFFKSTIEIPCAISKNFVTNKKCSDGFNFCKRKAFCFFYRHININVFLDFFRPSVNQLFDHLRRWITNCHKLVNSSRSGKRFIESTDFFICCKYSNQVTSFSHAVHGCK